MTGAVASERVTEAPKRFPQRGRKSREECKGRRELDCESNTTSRYESRGLVIRWYREWKGHRSTDKSYPGDNRLISPKSPYRRGGLAHLDVGSSHPGAEVGPKGWAVRPLKWYVSWVQNVVRQFGPYPSRAQEI